MTAFWQVLRSRVGDGTGRPTGIALATHTQPMAYHYLKPHGFTRHKELKNVAQAYPTKVCRISANVRISLFVLHSFFFLHHSTLPGFVIHNDR
jgi:hypothetical protein